MDLIVLSRPAMWNLNFCLGLSFGMSVILLYFLCSQLLEEILDWKVKTKQLRRSDFVWPYDLGPGDNWRQVVTASGWPLGNGVEWKVRTGGDQHWVGKQILNMMAMEKEKDKEKEKETKGEEEKKKQ